VQTAETLEQWFSTFFELGPTFVFKKISGPTRTTPCQTDLLLLRHYTAYYVIGQQTNFSLAARFWGICLLSAFILLRRSKLASVSIFNSLRPQRLRQEKSVTAYWRRNWFRVFQRIISPVNVRQIVQAKCWHLKTSKNKRTNCG